MRPKKANIHDFIASLPEVSLMIVVLQRTSLLVPFEIPKIILVKICLCNSVVIHSYLSPGL